MESPDLAAASAFFLSPVVILCGDQGHRSGSKGKNGSLGDAGTQSDLSVIAGFVESMKKVIINDEAAALYPVLTTNAGLVEEGWRSLSRPKEMRDLSSPLGMTRGILSFVDNATKTYAIEYSSLRFSHSP